MTYNVGRQGMLRLVLNGGKKTTISEQFIQAPYHIQRAIHCDDTMQDMAHLYMMSSSGGILGNDSHAIRVTLKDKARARLMTQGATRIYDTQDGTATQGISITLEQDSYLEFLPDITIPYKNSRYEQSVDIVCHQSATMIYTETLSPGRRAFGESFDYTLYKNVVSAKSDEGAWILHDAALIEPARRSVQKYGIMGLYDTLCTVYILAPGSIVPRMYDGVNDAIRHQNDILGGASIIHDKAGIIVRILSNKTETIQRVIDRIVHVVRYYRFSPVALRGGA